MAETEFEVLVEQHQILFEKFQELAEAHDKLLASCQNDHCKLLAIKEIAENTIAKRPHSDNTIFENILKIIKE